MCGLCCKLPNGKDCKHIVRLKNGKTLCRVYKTRLGRTLAPGVICGPREMDKNNYEGCPFNKPEYEGIENE